MKLLSLTLISLLLVAADAQSPLASEKTGSSAVQQADRQFLAELQTQDALRAVPEQAARVVPRERKPDAAPAPVAINRPKVARKASPPKDRTPVRRAQAVAVAERAAVMAKRPVLRPVVVAERPLLVAARDRLPDVQVRSVEVRTQTIRGRERPPNLWTRIFGPDNDDEDKDN